MKRRYGEPLSPVIWQGKQMARQARWRIDGRARGVIIFRRAVAYAVRYPRGVAAMVKNIVAGCTLVTLIIMVLLAYAQKHDEFCRHGHLIKSHAPCGSVSSPIGD